MRITHEDVALPPQFPREIRLLPPSFYLAKTLTADPYPLIHGVLIEAGDIITSKRPSSKLNNRAEMPCSMGLAAPQHLKYRTA
jgi:hypothetical protein